MGAIRRYKLQNIQNRLLFGLLAEPGTAARLLGAGAPLPGREALPRACLARARWHLSVPEIFLVFLKDLYNNSTIAWVASHEALVLRR